MSIRRGSPEHIQAISAIDAEHFPRINDLRRAFRKSRPDVAWDALDDHPDWLSLSAELREEHGRELMFLRASLVDSPDEL